LTGAVRCHLLAGAAPGRPEERVLVQLKSNLSALAPGLGYAIDRAGSFHWTGASPLIAAEILSPAPDADQRSALQEAMEFLRSKLSGGPEWAWSIQGAAKNVRISAATLRRAKDWLGIVSTKSSTGPWEWKLPDSHQPQATSNQPDEPTKAALGSRFPRLPSGQAPALGKTEAETSNEPQATSNKQEEAVASGQWSVASEKETLGHPEQSEGSAVLSTARSPRGPKADPFGRLRADSSLPLRMTPFYVRTP
jgi:hypothetical protein